VTAVDEIPMEEEYTALRLQRRTGRVGEWTLEGKPTDFEGAVRILLRPSCRKFLLHLRKRVSESPTFMFHYEHSIGVKVQRVLYRHGIRWAPEMMFTNWAKVLRVAMGRMDDQIQNG